MSEVDSKTIENLATEFGKIEPYITGLKNMDGSIFEMAVEKVESVNEKKAVADSYASSFDPFVTVENETLIIHPNF